MQQSLNPWITHPAPADGADTAAPRSARAAGGRDQCAAEGNG